MKRQRILHILPDGSPGGGGTAVLGLCRDLLREGAWEVGLVTGPDTHLARTAAQDGITVLPLDFFTSRLDPRLPGRLRHLVDAFAPDILHAHGARAGLPCLAALPSPRRPLVVTVHGYHHANKGLTLRTLGRLAERQIARHADALVFLSESDRRRADREGILDRHDQRGHLIPNGIDPADFDDIAPAEAGFDLVFAGRAHPQKNPLFMVEIMESLAGSGFRLLMISGGPLESALKARIAASPARASITHVGAQPRSAVLAAFRAARLLVMPSLWEGLPITPLEALHLGLPVLASQVEGTTDLLTDGLNARLIRGFSAEEYAGAVRVLLENPALGARLADNGRRLVAANHLRQPASRAHAALYTRLLEAQ
jgi:glycosyltransferase involved in cell wall biosynthesis